MAGLVPDSSHSLVQVLPKKTAHFRRSMGVFYVRVGGLGVTAFQRGLCLPADCTCCVSWSTASNHFFTSLRVTAFKRTL